MLHFNAKSRIAFGLILILVSVLLFAISWGLVPDARQAVMQGRAALCESIAVNTSHLVSRGDVDRMQAIMELIVERNEDILSAAVRRADGDLVVEVGEHTEQWKPLKDNRSNEAQVYVPIKRGDTDWGSVEIRFAPLRHIGLAGWLANTWVRLVIFVCSVTFVLYYYYLRKMLQHLDPSRVVPPHVRAAFDTVASGILLMDNKERIVLANRTFAQTVGRTPEALQGVRASELEWTDEQGSGTPEEFPWQHAIERREPQTGSILGMEDAAAGRRTFVVNTAPVIGQDGRHKGALASFEDVTTLENTKLELEVARDAAEEANRTKSEFLAHMSHEIRTPMTAVLGFTDVLRRGMEDGEAERQEYLRTIHSSGSHLLNLINDILDLSKVEAGQMEVELIECPLHDIIWEVVEVLRVRAEAKEIALDYRSEGPIPVTIQTDPGRVRQMITNLAGNAIKFTDEGGVEIVTRLVETAGRPQLAIDITDTGIGLKPDALQKIFDPFSQADSSTTRRFGGTGLGLAISKQFAEMLGGEISVTSTYGEGSTFTVTIDTGPLEGIERVDAGEAKQRAQQQTAAQGETPLELPPGRVLVVDDGVANRKLITLVLGRAGAVVDTAENGQIGVEKATATHYDVILMDMQMPVMDGYTAAFTLREAGYERPIIALTAHAMKGDEEKCRAAGCSGFLTKPINVDQLIRTVAAELTHIPADAPRPAAAATGSTSTGPAAEASPAPATTPGAAPHDGRPRLISTLPTEDAEIRELVIGFVELLHEQLATIDAAWKERDFGQIEDVAHSIKGAGGSLGFDDFTTPAANLEEAARNANAGPIPELIATLHDLADRIYVAPAEGEASDMSPATPTRAASDATHP